MFDFILMAALGIGLGVLLPLHYLIVGAAGLVVGFLFGGVMFFIKILPILFIAFVVPLVYALSSGKAFSLLGLAITAGALTAGYSIGSLIGVVVMPFRIFGKIISFFWKIIRH